MVACLAKGEVCLLRFGEDNCGSLSQGKELVEGRSQLLERHIRKIYL